MSAYKSSVKVFLIILVSFFGFFAVIPGIVGMYVWYAHAPITRNLLYTVDQSVLTLDTWVKQKGFKDIELTVDSNTTDFKPGWFSSSWKIHQKYAVDYAKERVALDVTVDVDAEHGLVWWSRSFLMQPLLLKLTPQIVIESSNMPDSVQSAIRKGLQQYFNAQKKFEVGLGFSGVKNARVVQDVLTDIEEPKVFQTCFIEFNMPLSQEDFPLGPITISPAQGSRSNCKYTFDGRTSWQWQEKEGSPLSIALKGLSSGGHSGGSFNTLGLHNSSGFFELDELSFKGLQTPVRLDKSSFVYHWPELVFEHMQSRSQLSTLDPGYLALRLQAHARKGALASKVEEADTTKQERLFQDTVMASIWNLFPFMQQIDAQVFWDVNSAAWKDFESSVVPELLNRSASLQTLSAAVSTLAVRVLQSAELGYTINTAKGQFSVHSGMHAVDSDSGVGFSEARAQLEVEYDDQLWQACLAMFEQYVQLYTPESSDYASLSTGLHSAKRLMGVLEANEIVRNEGGVWRMQLSAQGDDITVNTKTMTKQAWQQEIGKILAEINPVLEKQTEHASAAN